MAVERMQSAIARARAKRAGLATVFDADVDADSDYMPMPDDDIIEPVEREDWNQLPKSGVTASILDRARIVTAGLDSDANAFDVLRTKVLQRMKAERWKRIAITSVDRNCGASIVAMNIAFALSRQSAVRTILVEANLRRPSLARALHLSPPASLDQVLRREVSLPKSLVRVRDNLAVLANKGSVPGSVRQSAELLQGDALPGVLSGIERAYQPDVMIFDLPSLTEAEDALAFLQNVDCVLLVTLAEHTTPAQIATCVRDVSARTTLVGIVLNGYHGADVIMGA